MTLALFGLTTRVGSVNCPENQINSCRGRPGVYLVIRLELVKLSVEEEDDS